MTDAMVREALAKPDSFGWFGDDDMFVTWGLCGPGYSRDSDPLAISNTEYIYNDLRARWPEDVDLIEMSHWAHGWLKQITVRVVDDEGNPTPVFEALMEWKENLENYPIANDDHYEAKQAEMEVLDCD